MCVCVCVCDCNLSEPFFYKMRRLGRKSVPCCRSRFCQWIFRPKGILPLARSHHRHTHANNTLSIGLHPVPPPPPPPRPFRQRRREDGKRRSSWKSWRRQGVVLGRPASSSGVRGEADRGERMDQRSRLEVEPVVAALQLVLHVALELVLHLVLVELPGHLQLAHVVYLLRGRVAGAGVQVEGLLHVSVGVKGQELFVDGYHLRPVAHLCAQREHGDYLCIQTARSPPSPLCTERAR